ncbi:MAG: ATP-dependent Clp protease adaptor ClpS [Planctomycetales bacterium]|nr:ATP-dependent Clp protease adaptor ClpS [Planctomycetales bacterium]
MRGATEGSPSAPAPLVVPRVAPRTDTTPRLAPRYRVLIHNDDVTPMEFVVDVLRGVFAKEETEAVTIMLEAHHTGVALVAVLALEQAEWRIGEAHSLARARKFPLTFTAEPEA